MPPHDDAPQFSYGRAFRRDLSSSGKLRSLAWPRVKVSGPHLLRTKCLGGDLRCPSQGLLQDSLCRNSASSEFLRFDCCSWCNFLPHKRGALPARASASSGTSPGASTGAPEEPGRHLRGTTTITPRAAITASRATTPPSQLPRMASGNGGIPTASDTLASQKIAVAAPEGVPLFLQGSLQGPAPPLDPMVSMAVLEQGVLRWDVSATAREEAMPSLSFEDPRKREMELEDGDGATEGSPDLKPECFVRNGQQVVVIKLPEGTSVYGTGEVAGPLERSGFRTFSWNTDAWGYNQSTTSLYQSHPWVFAVLADGRAVGILADTTRRCEIDMREKGIIRFSADTFYPVLTFGPLPHPADVMKSLTRATGCAPLPPRWALAYHQSRFSYEPAARVLQVARLFREKKIPCDVIWMDIDYMQDFQCFTFHKTKFSQPKQMADELHGIGFKAVWMIEPGLKAKEGYKAYDEGCKLNLWVGKSDGTPFVGDVWPGPCTFPDFTMERTRKWWAGMIADFASNGVDGIWNDMNEPALFTTSSKTMPRENVHQGDEELGGTQNHSHYHNVYGMLMSRSTMEGLKQARPDHRPFVLTRANFIGGHRYAATWTGDNLADWDHLHWSIPMALNLGLSGQPFSGPDIGGFAGDSNPRLFGRWMGLGALLPFARGHSEAGTMPHEPWEFGSECEAVCRAAIERRYRLLPHIYTLFYRAHTTGVPEATPVFFADPSDPSLRGISTSFLLGPLLVAACTSSHRMIDEEQVALPRGMWRPFDFGDYHPDLPQLYVQGGAIVPTGPVVQHTGEIMGDDTVTLVVSLDEKGHAEGEVFEDAGDGYGYLEGDFLLTTYRATMVAGVPDGVVMGVAPHGAVVVEVARSEGQRGRPKRRLVVRVLLDKGAEVSSEGVDGELVVVPLPSDAELARIVGEREVAIQRLKAEARALLEEHEEAEAVVTTKATPKTIALGTGEWLLRVLPGIGGRIISLVHAPTGREWLDAKYEFGGYEEYTGTEYRSPGCVESYSIVAHETKKMDGEDAITLEADVGGGLLLARRIGSPVGMPENLHITSAIVAKSVGAGSGGRSRIVCLRVHPTFRVSNATCAAVSFHNIRGEYKELLLESGEVSLTGDDRPDGEWRLVDRDAKVALVNQFDVAEVANCHVHWTPQSCNLELWSEERPVSANTPIRISHSYHLEDHYDREA